MNAKFDIKANAVQLMAEPSGIQHPDGTIKSNLCLQAPGVTLKVPIELFPFLRAGTGVLVTLSIVQIQPEPAAPAILLPGDLN